MSKEYSQTIDHQIELLQERSVDIILQAGVPLPLLAGPDFLTRLLTYIENKANVPATSTVLNVVAAIKHLGLKKIAVANKWSNQMNATLEEFFTRDGISVVGVNTRSMNPSEFVKISSEQSMTLGYQLGRRALEELSHRRRRLYRRRDLDDIANNNQIGNRISQASYHKSNSKCMACIASFELLGSELQSGACY